MRPQELRDLYTRCCDAKNYLPNKGQLNEWNQQLGHMDLADLTCAIDEWFDNNAKFPMPSDLRPLALRYQALRTKRIDPTRRLVRWQCESCEATICGFPSANTNLDQHCQKRVNGRATQDGFPICAGRMKVIYQENAA